MKLIITYVLIMLACLNLASRASASQTSQASQYEQYEHEHCKKVSGEDAQILQELVLGDDAPQAYQYLTESLELTGWCLNRWLEKLNMVPEYQAPEYQRWRGGE